MTLQERARAALTRAKYFLPTEPAYADTEARVAAALLETVRECSRAICFSCARGVPMLRGQHFVACTRPETCAGKDDHVELNGRKGYLGGCYAEDIFAAFPDAPHTEEKA